MALAAYGVKYYLTERLENDEKEIVNLQKWVTYLNRRVTMLETELYKLKIR